MCFRTWTGVRGDHDEAVLCSRDLTACFGDEVLLRTRQTCRETWDELKSIESGDFLNTPVDTVDLSLHFKWIPSVVIRLHIYI